MERNIQKNGLINLLILLAVGVAGFAVSRYSNSLAGLVSVVFVGLGVLVAGVSWFQMRLEERERLEKLEFDEMAKARSGSGLFETKDAEIFPAQRAREQFERFLVPAFTVILFLAQAGGAFLFWRWLSKIAVTQIKFSLVAMALFGLFFLVLFLLGKFSASIARLESQRLMRPGAGYLLLGAYLCFLVTAGIAGVEVGFAKVDLYLARGLCGLLSLIALETLINLTLEIYRPRVKGKVTRPLYESRLVGLMAHPEGLITTAAQAIDYQFGFKVSETWFYRTLVEKLPWFGSGLIAALLLSTCIVFIEPGEQGLLERFGWPVASREVLGPGPHFKFPWPMDKVYRFATREIQTFNIGFVPDPAREKETTVLWTVSHYKEEFNLLVASREQQSSGDTNQPGTEQAVPVNLLTASIPVQYQITNVVAWAYNHEDAQALLEQLATREVVRYLVGADLLDIMSTGREKAAADLRQQIQERANELNLGVEILFVGLQDIHPPVKVAGAYEAVNGAAQEVEAKILKAEGEAARVVPLAQADAQKKIREAQAEAVRRVTGAAALATRFANQIQASKAAPEVYSRRLYLQTLAKASAGARIYIVAPTNTTDVIQFNLEDKLPEIYEKISVPPPNEK